MSAITTPTHVLAFEDGARTQTDDALIFAAGSLKGAQDYESRMRYWTIIGVLAERHPAAADKALKSGDDKRAMIDLMLPHLIG